MIYKTQKIAREMLEQQPFTLACRAWHVVVPCYARNLLGEKTSDTPIGYTYRLKGTK